MAKYDVYVVCDQCGQPHAVNVKLDLDEGGLDRTPVADAFEPRAVMIPTMPATPPICDPS